MSLKAKIEAVIYAAEEPVTLVQLAAIFGEEVLAAMGTPATTENLAFDSSMPVRSSEEDSQLPTPVAEAGPVPSSQLESDDASAPSQPDLPMDDAEAKKQARLRDRQARVAIQKIVDGLIAEYADGERGMEIREIAGGYRIATKAEYHDAVRSFVKSLKPQMKLSLQALETLAVVAYKQPVTAPEIGEIRGVDSAGVLGGLLARKLITTAGRKQVIGRPILYKTTKEFLLRFGLKDVNELPSMEEFEKMAADMAEPELSESENTQVESSPNSSIEPAGETHSMKYVTHTVTEKPSTDANTEEDHGDTQ